MEPWKPGAISEEERAERARPARETRVHVCLGCRTFQDEDDMIYRDGWFCGNECRIELLRRLIRSARRNAVEQVRELRREIRRIQKSDAATMGKVR